MNDFLKNMVNPINRDKRWDLIQKLYNKNYFNVKNKNKESKIPKIIHQIWLGGDFPKEYEYYRDKMMDINIGWEYKLWTDKDVDSFGLQNIKLFNNITNLGARSDIFRYEILDRMGGIYIDTDFDTVKSFDDLTHLDFFAGNGHVDTPEVFNSIMASIPGHKYMNNIVNELLKKDTFLDDIPGVMNNTGPYFVSRVFFDTINEGDNVVIFPTKFLFPFPAVHRHQYHRLSDEQYLNLVSSFYSENTYVSHLWHTTWQK